VAAAAPEKEETVQAREVPGSAVPVPRAARSIWIHCYAAPLCLVMPPLHQDLPLRVHLPEPSLRELVVEFVPLLLRSVQRGINMVRGNGWGTRGERLRGAIKRKVIWIDTITTFTSQKYTTTIHHIENMLLEYFFPLLEPTSIVFLP
jgi:hypothetical protein